MRGARGAIAAASFTVALLLACSTRPAGLELIITTDLKAPDDFDKLQLQVSQEGTPGVKELPFTEPGAAPFPVTFAIAAGSRADQEAIIDVSVLKAGTVVVSRQAQVQVPKDRVAELTLVLGRKCVGVTCVAGETCDPEPDAGTGECVSTVVNSSTLPTFAPVEVDAAAAATGAGSTSGSEPGSEGESGSGGGSSGSASSGGSSSGSGGPGEDASSDAPRDSPVVVDSTIDRGVIDTGPEPPSDSPPDSPVDAPGEGSPDAPSDACVPTSATEICTNGIDDNCDGLIDCAEPSCQAAGYTCVATAPAGWTGPASLWTGAFGATAPSCPMGYQATDLYAGPTGSAVSCTCSCTASGQMCSATGTFHVDAACASACRTVTLSATTSGTGTCTDVTGSGCGSAGSIASGAVSAPSGGSCTPQEMPMTTGPLSWTTAARVCSWVGQPDMPSGCATAGEQCVGSQGDSGLMACVYQSGDVACPAGYATKNLLYAGEMDGRTCAGCACGGTPTGGSCAGTISFWGSANNGCGGAAAGTYTLGNSCTSYSGAANDPGYAQATFTVTQGACLVTTQPTVTGAVTGTGPMTVCCN